MAQISYLISDVNTGEELKEKQLAGKLKNLSSIYVKLFPILKGKKNLKLQITILDLLKIKEVTLTYYGKEIKKITDFLNSGEIDSSEKWLANGEVTDYIQELYENSKFGKEWRKSLYDEWVAEQDDDFDDEDYYESGAFPADNAAGFEVFEQALIGKGKAKLNESMNMLRNLNESSKGDVVKFLQDIKLSKDYKNFLKEFDTGYEIEDFCRFIYESYDFRTINIFLLNGKYKSQSLFERKISNDGYDIIYNDLSKTVDYKTLDKIIGVPSEKESMKEINNYMRGVFED
jgi:hypothetical protein